MDKVKILINTIVRNRAKFLYQYHSQIKEFVKTFKDIDFHLAIYENDSTDNTKKNLKNIDFSFIDHVIICEKIGTELFGSVPNEQRVKNISSARNRCLEIMNINNFDNLLIIDSDIRYDITTIEKILTFKHRHNLKRVDAVSPVLWVNNIGDFAYDTWGIRRNKYENRGTLNPDWKSKKYDKYYATSNGICLYNSIPFKAGVKFGWYNEELKSFDCEMVVLCQNFHKLKFSEIYIDYESHCFVN